ncbi:hypothetical protein JR316_0013170 [Psilocybe cubensis]|uniref:Uncharacterized protein n=2 Tax=Psilocybe cubensis TaxID=181762 RepID=A0ACB8GGZ5_PSICU|nr:hypothetical protein JR316_0013170 [Psilocybe cubensis]KAH9474705.1 hypothetical protein JR316_0013170 [Psilocybe cubensis]
MGIRPNSNKRVQNENMPPSAATRSVLNAKFVASQSPRRTSRTLRDVQFRKRSESSTGVQTTKRIVGHAKQRQAKNKIRFTLKSAIRGKINDVEMADGTVHPSSNTVPIQLPQELVRPREYKAVTPDMLKAVDQTYDDDMGVQYFRDGLEILEKELMQSLASVKIQNQRTKLPSELDVVVNDATIILPSHVLAVFGKAPPPGSSAPRQVTLYPVHSLVLKAHCAHLPLPPPTLEVPNHVSGEQTVKLPVWSICLPSPEAYPALSVYLYTKDIQRLLRNLVPMPAPEDLRVTPGRTKEFGQQMGHRFSIAIIVRATFLVYGVWQNMCALGIFDKQLWDTIDAVWNSILFAMSVATGNPTMPIPPYQPVDEGYGEAEPAPEGECEAGPSGDVSPPSDDLSPSTKDSAGAGSQGPEGSGPHH